MMEECRIKTTSFNFGDLSRNALHEDVLVDYLMAPTQDDISSGVQLGIGPRTRDILSAEGINSGFQLHAKFLSFREPGMNPLVHMEVFYQWLCALRTVANLLPSIIANIFHAVTNKADIIYPEMMLNLPLTFNYHFDD